MGACSHFFARAVRLRWGYAATEGKEKKVKKRCGGLRGIGYNCGHGAVLSSVKK